MAKPVDHSASNRGSRKSKRKTSVYRSPFSFLPTFEQLEDRVVPTLNFNLIPAAGMSQASIDAFQEGADAWSEIFDDNIQVNINIDFRDLGAGIIAQASSVRFSDSYADVRAALTADSTSDDDTTAVANLPTGDSFSVFINRTLDHPTAAGNAAGYVDDNGGANNTTISMTRANAKALGLIPNADTDTTVDADITFNSTFTFDLDRSDGITAGETDFVGVAIHEIGHAMGFISGVDVLDQNSSDPFFNADAFDDVSPLDLFRFSDESIAAGADIDWRADDVDIFFSIDGGVTKLGAVNTFSTGVTQGDGQQASHWKDNLGLGIMDPTAAGGEFLVITNLDIQSFDVIGWTLFGPTVAVDTATLTDDEGQTFTNSGMASDPTDGDNVRITASVGTITQQPGGNGGVWNWEFDSTDGPDETQTVTITATNSQGLSNTTTFSLNVNNVAPTIALTGAATANTSDPYALTLGAITDPGDDTVTAFTINWGDGTSDTFNRAPNLNEIVNHTFARDGNLTITVSLTDEDGTHVAGTLNVTVTDSTPLVSTLVDSPSSVQPGGTISYTATITNRASITDATDVEFSSDLDPLLTLDGTSIRVTPIAIDDSYTGNDGATVNQELTVNVTNGLIANDIDPDRGMDPAPTVIVSSVQQTGGVNGTLEVFADGSFNFTGTQVGTATFSYDILDFTGLQNIVSATITIEVSAASPLFSEPTSVEIADLSLAELHNVIEDAKARWESMGMGSFSLAELEKLQFSIADLNGTNLAGIAGNHVVLDRDAVGNGWFVDVTPQQDEEFSNGVALSGNTAEGRIDLLSLVMQQMDKYLHPQTLDQTSLVSDVLEPGVRQIPTLNASLSTLSQLRTDYGFTGSPNGDYHNAFGAQEKWFRSRDGGWFAILPTGQIYRGAGGQFSAQPIATVSPVVYQDLSFLYEAPVKLSQTDLDQIAGLQQTHNLQVTRYDAWVNWSGASEKWFRGDSGAFTLTPDGTLRRWEGGSVLNGQVVAQLNPIVYDDHSLLVTVPGQLDEARDQLSQADLDQLTDLQSQHAFHKSGDLYFNWSGAGEKWFLNRSGTWHTITADGVIRRGGPFSQNVIAQVSTAVYENPELLFEATPKMSPAMIETLAQLRSEHGFHSESPQYYNWAGQSEKWFKDAQGRGHSITSDGVIRRYQGGSGLGAEIARVSSNVWLNLDLLLKASPMTITTEGEGAAPADEVPSLTQEQLDALSTAAIQRWADAGLSAEQQALMESIVFEIADLSGWQIGQHNGDTITIDINGAGRGWFVDATPLTDEEFDGATSETRLTSSSMGGQLDALTTVMHELGHVLGLEDSYAAEDSEDLMYGYLSNGERRLPSDGQADDAVVEVGGEHNAMLAPIDIGDLPRGKAVQIFFDAVLDNPVSIGDDSVSVQGTTTSQGNPDELTDDPDTSELDDPTVTIIDAAPDLRITLTNTLPARVLRDGTLRYDFSLANFGTQGALGTAVRVTVPTYITLNTALSTAGWEDQGNGLFVFTTGTFQIGDTGAVSLVVNVPLVSQGATIPLTARFVDNGSQGRDLNPDDNVVRIFSIIENADAERWV